MLGLLIKKTAPKQALSLRTIYPSRVLSGKIAGLASILFILIALPVTAEYSDRYTTILTQGRCDVALTTRYLYNDRGLYSWENQPDADDANIGWKDVSSSVSVLGNEDEYWLTFRIVNRGPEGIKVILFPSEGTDFAEIRMFDGEGSAAWTLGKSGFDDEASRILVTMTAGGEYDFLVRMRPHGQAKFSAYAFDFLSYSQASKIRGMLFGLVLGILIGLLCYNLIIAVSTKIIEPLIIPFLILQIVYCLLSNGLGSVFFGDSTWLYDRAIPFSTCGVMLLSIMITRKMLETRNGMKTLDIILRLHEYSIPVLVLLFLTIPFHLVMSIGGILVLSASLTITIAAVQAKVQRQPDSAVFLTAWGFFIISIIIAQLLSFGFSVPGISSYGIKVEEYGAIGQSALFSLIAARRINRLKTIDERASALEEINKKLSMLDRAKTCFFANSSHELRTPLTLIVAPLESIIAGRFGKSIPYDAPIFEMIKRNADRLKRKADELLEFLRLDSGDAKPKPIPVDLGALVSCYVADFTVIAEKRRIKVVFNQSPDVVALIDPAMMETVLLNLLSNAVKFTRADGIVSVSVEKKDQRCILTVADNGIGIEKERIPELFTRYSESGYRDRTDYSGFGIGLPLSAEIVRLMGGEISLSSEVDRGSAFSVSFPSSDVKPVAFTKPSTERIASYIPDRGNESELTPKKNKSNAPIVLVVDDDPDMSSFVSCVLSPTFTVVRAASAPEALKLLDSGCSPRVIVSDVMMPKMDGFEFRRAVLASDRFSGIPFLFLSAKTDYSAKLEGLEAGAVDYIAKPFEPECLVLKISSLIATADSGRRYMEAQVRSIFNDDRVICGASGKDWRDRAESFGLSERDMQIVQLVVEGKSDKEIGVCLGLSVRTISNRVSSILKASNCPNRTTLVTKLKG